MIKAFEAQQICERNRCKRWTFPLEYVCESISDRLLVLSTPPLDSMIISYFLEIFAEFGRKQFSLQWRFGSDGFGACEQFD
jgi:hypothetical protein